MKKNYEIPSAEVIHITSLQHLLQTSGEAQVSGRWGSNATRPAKVRRNGREEIDDWDDGEEEEYN